MASPTAEILLDNYRRQLYSDSALVRMSASYLGPRDGRGCSASSADLLGVMSRFLSHAVECRQLAGCLFILATTFGLVFAQPADAPPGDLDGAQVTSGWGPMRPTAKPGRTPSIPYDITYGPVRVHELSLSDAHRILALKAVPSGPNEGKRQPPTTYGQYLGSDGLGLYERAWMLGPHPLLAQLLPGVEFYVPDLGFRLGGLQLCGVRDGKAYELPRQFSYLWRDCGGKFTKDEVPSWARTLCLLRVVDENVRRAFWQYWADTTKPMVPEVSFQSVVVETVEVGIPEVRVHLTVEGQPQEMRLRMWMPWWGHVPTRDTLHYWPSDDDIDMLPEQRTDGGPVLLMGISGTWGFRGHKTLSHLRQGRSVFGFHRGIVGRRGEKSSGREVAQWPRTFSGKRSAGGHRPSDTAGRCGTTVEKGASLTFAAAGC